jgi:hypothetical protein
MILVKTEIILGATFWFIDMDYNRPGNSSMSLAYLEFARYFDLPYINPLGFTIQYNDGTSIYGSLGQAWLTGLSFPIHMKYIELSTEFLYRKVSGAHAPDFQFTLVWFKSFFKNKIHVTGYMDIWSQDRTIDSKQVAFQLEPQIWYFFRPALAIGGEMEISKNFLPQYNTVKFMPTIGVKWIF